MDRDYLWEKAGVIIQGGLVDDTVTDIQVNPDKNIWFKRKGSGYECVGVMDYESCESFVNAIAHMSDQYLNPELPVIDDSLPFNNERINIKVPPIVSSSAFDIRKPSPLIITLDEYRGSGIISGKQFDVIVQGVSERKNILVAGSPGSGKTTLTNAILARVAEVSPPGHRVIILEDKEELKCNVDNALYLRESMTVNMNKLLWVAMRSSPDRIVVGEVRNGNALDMLKAWNTGCPGGVSTIHSNSASATLQRVVDLACEATPNPPIELICEAIDYVIYIDSGPGMKNERLVTEIVSVDGYCREKGSFKTSLLA